MLRLQPAWLQTRVEEALEPDLAGGYLLDDLLADLELSDEVDAVLQAHINAAGGRFRGVPPILARHDAFNVTLPSPAPAGLMQRAAGTLNIMPVQLASQSGADLDSFQDSHLDGDGVVEFEALMRKIDRIDGRYQH